MKSTSNIIQSLISFENSNKKGSLPVRQGSWCYLLLVSLENSNKKGSLPVRQGFTVKILIKTGSLLVRQGFWCYLLLVSFEDSNKKGPSRPVRGPSPDGPGGTPDEDVALTHWEGVKFLAGINHNTPFVFIHMILTSCMVCWYPARNCTDQSW